ncbi:uncharacterized protein MKK02DRAFT_44217 [Dioszegia hungarica]|uniref:Uncharacterized protein n=1 Tax=Dioszegia hungarica TaxID=4972 RepID=A0AA38H7S4_9TREE|nr:uncharacterized protein MKK02DRAFT_44217 [Dioszegia hungarica]KAI9635527.1 hypothetical protein MKK02DRAFT_44217 [Dioszegia hungarica]
MSVNFTTIASVLTVAIGLTYLLLDSYVRRHPLSRALYPDEPNLIFPDEPPIPAVQGADPDNPLGYFSRRNLDRLAELAPRKSKANSKLFGAHLAVALGLGWRAGRSMKGKDVVLVLPAVPRCTYFRLQHQEIRERTDVERAPDEEERRHEMDILKMARVWYFATEWLSAWITEAGGHAKIIIRCSAPRVALREAFIDRSRIPHRLRTVVTLPGSEADIEALRFDNEVWSLEYLVERMRG